MLKWAGVGGQVYVQSEWQRTLSVHVSGPPKYGVSVTSLSFAVLLPPGYLCEGCCLCKHDVTSLLAYCPCTLCTCLGSGSCHAVLAVQLCCCAELTILLLACMQAVRTGLNAKAQGDTGRVMVVLLTDGRANVSLAKSNEDPEALAEGAVKATKVGLHASG